jgi:hypothetical protein
VLPRERQAELTLAMLKGSLAFLGTLASLVFPRRAAV